MGTKGSRIRWSAVVLFTMLGCGGTAFGPFDAGDGALEASPEAAPYDGTAAGDASPCGGEGGVDAPGEAGADVTVSDGAIEASAEAGPDAHVEASPDAPVEAAAGSDAAEADGGSRDGGAGDGASGGDADASPLQDGAASDASDGATGHDGEGGGDGGPEACVPVLYFNDGDVDGYGGTTTITQCDPPATGHWVARGGDCDDSNDAVNPGQTAYFENGYVPTGQSAVSFDYDCSGAESESGGAAHADCQVVSLACTGSGHLEASPVRTGPGVDPFCGSDQAVTCAFSSLACKAGSPYTTGAIACR
jgi:hypothetical protein